MSQTWLRLVTALHLDKTKTNSTNLLMPLIIDKIPLIQIGHYRCP